MSRSTVRRLMAVGTGALGWVTMPLALAVSTWFLAVLAHLALCVSCATLAIWDGAAGRPVAARAWGAWAVVVTGGLVAALHVASWGAGGFAPTPEGGWGWRLPVFFLLVWGWIPAAVSVVAGVVGDRRRAHAARRAVRRRHAVLAAR